jgi:UDP-glucose 4-epimerase
MLEATSPETVFISGGAGFIGSHLTDRLLADPRTRRVTLFDNFSSGREWHFQHHLADSRFRIIRGDLLDVSVLQRAIGGHELVIHLASNPDIARAATQPAVDFEQGTLLTHSVLEAMRIDGRARNILYTSGSGVYGDLGEVEAHEDHGPLVPISTYGASKLAGEAMISAYTHMFGLSACVFRLANVVGPRQTHGVGRDFIRRLAENPRTLRVLGDGTQSKSYIHVGDVVQAMMLALERSRGGYAVYNVATEDYVSVREIADLAIECVGLDPTNTAIRFSGGKRGWKGDIPVVRLNTNRIRSLGWSNSFSSRLAVQNALQASLEELRAGLL